MTTTYRLPDGFTIAALGEAAATWNGWPVPILDLEDYLTLGHHLDLTIDSEEAYRAHYVHDISDPDCIPGWHCDGLQWEHVMAEVPC